MLAIISDIHGNHTALVAVLNAIEDLAIDKVVCLGDICGYYCDINECCEELRLRGIESLMGNHDWYLTSGNKCLRSNSVNHCIKFQSDVIHKNHLKWLKSLNHSSEISGIRITHGGWNNPLDEVFTPSTDYFSKLQGNLFSSGHTHLPHVWSEKMLKYCNPGSVGQPRDGDPRASFATWDGEKFELCRVSYEFKRTQQRMKSFGFDPYFYENLSIGSKIGGKIVECAQKADP